MGPELAELAELLAEARAKAEGARPEHRRCRLAAEPGLGHARPHPLGSPSRSKGAPRGLSIAVVGMNHRTVPPASAGADDRFARSTCPRRCRTCRRARTWTRSSSFRPACAPRCTPWSTGSTGPWRTSGSSWPRGAASRPKSSRAASTPTSTKRPSTTSSGSRPASTRHRSANPRCWARSAKPGRWPATEGPAGRS